MPAVSRAGHALIRTIARAETRREAQSSEARAAGAPVRRAPPEPARVVRWADLAIEQPDAVRAVRTEAVDAASPTPCSGGAFSRRIRRALPRGATRRTCSSDRFRRRRTRRRGVRLSARRRSRCRCRRGRRRRARRALRRGVAARAHLACRRRCRCHRADVARTRRRTGVRNTTTVNNDTGEDTRADARAHADIIRARRAGRCPIRDRHRQR